MTDLAALLAIPTPDEGVIDVNAVAALPRSTRSPPTSSSRVTPTSGPGSPLGAARRGPGGGVPPHPPDRRMDAALLPGQAKLDAILAVEQLQVA
jgi:hypothetical protein